MKMHKIGNVDLKVCCCEQKIAYNAAFYACARWNYREEYKRGENISGIFRSDVVHAAVAAALKRWENEKCNKYDIDLIACCLRAGMENYLKGNSVLWSYEEIGKTFPNLYYDELMQSRK